MRRTFSGRGDTKLGCIVWILVLGLAAYVGTQAVPAQMKASDLKKFMNGVAEHRAEEPVDKIAASILARVKDLGLPVDKDKLEVDRNGGRIRMSYSYTVPINLVVTVYEWNVNATVDRLIVIA